MKAAKTRREKGFAIVLTTLALTSTLLIAGLGFDVGTLYLIRTKLQGAMDAAALATVRTLAQNPNATAARTVGEEFLIANFPNGYWGAQPLSSMPVANAITISEIDQNGNAGTPGSTATAKLVTVTAGVTAPLYFLRVLGQQTATISYTSQATRQGLLVMLVLDGSGSMMNTSFNGNTPCVWAQIDAQAFLGYSQFDPDIDRIGAVAFGGNTYTSAPIANFQAPAGTLNTSSQVYTDLNTFSASGCGGNTNTVEGLQAAYKAIQTFYGGAGVQATRANVIVLMTDGAPNGFSADWTTATLVSGSKCGPPASGHLTGYTARETATEWGIMNIAQTPSSVMHMQGQVNITDNTKCAFTQASKDSSYFYQDFTTVPPTDAYGDALYGIGTYITAARSAMPTDPSPSSAANPPSPEGDSGTTAEQQFRDLSSNAADGGATRIRSDSKLRIAIYTIELDGNSGANVYDYPDTTLLQRIANATSSPVYNPSQPVGGYYDASNALGLSAEFAAVASAITARLSK